MVIEGFISGSNDLFILSELKAGIQKSIRVKGQAFKIN
jgi:hypothetical protein